MSDAGDLVHRLFGTPGGTPGDDNLLAQAAAAHAGLFAEACTSHDPVVSRTAAPIRAFLSGPSAVAAKRQMLDHPLFVEGLHGLSPFFNRLHRWHDSVTALPVGGEGSPAPAARASLGHVALSLTLRADPQWRGDLDLCTDALGRVGFPFSDWTLAVRTDHGEPLGGRAISVAVGHARACWRVGPVTAGRPFLVMPRADLLRLVAGAPGDLDVRHVTFPDAEVRPRLQRACPLGRSPIRYDPVGIADGAGHAGVTGWILARLLAAVRRNSPTVYREFRAYVRTVRGFEFPPTAAGVVDSFSDPTLPGVVGFSVPYTTGDEPMLDPLCFTWLGHEMGHTKDYLCDTVLFGRGERMVANAEERTPLIARYGRSLALRTVFQVPYVHLYEWALLMDFCEAGFRGLPWDVTADVAAAGDDLGAEIEEAFALIRDRAALTALGRVALRHFEDLFARARRRWLTVRGRWN